MSKKHFFIFGIVVLIVFLFLDEIFRKNFVIYTLQIKSALINTKDRIENKIATCFNQSSRIEELEAQVSSLQKYEKLYQDIKHRYASLLKVLPTTFDLRSYDLKLTKMISYVKLGDFSSAWLDAKLKLHKIYGLIGSDGVAGIAVGEKNGAIAYFNGNPKCSYAVNIGEGTKGIVTGIDNGKYVTVKYISTFSPIKKGDFVVTSGLDGIFPYGIRVGRVVDFWQEGSYKVARVKSAQNLDRPLFFWLVDIKTNEVIK